MTTREALLAGILADPADDMRRLIFADWLEENGESDRAEFIRAHILKCEWQGTPVNCNSYIQSCHRCVVVRRFFDNASIIDGRAVPMKLWDRGFISKLHGPLAALLEHGPAICREHPVDSVEVTDYHAECIRDEMPSLGYAALYMSIPNVRRSEVEFPFLPTKTPGETTKFFHAAVLAELKIRAAHLPEEREQAI